MIALEPAFHLTDDRPELRHQVIRRGDVELDGDISIDPLEDFFGAFGEGVDFELGEVQIRRAEAEEPVQGEEDGGSDGNAGSGEEPAAVFAALGGTTGWSGSAHGKNKEIRKLGNGKTLAARIRPAWSG